MGTVDRFQGKEAVVAILTMAASSGREAPRGLEFLLLRNRINVAISRAMQAAYVVYSPALLDDLPRTPEGVARLSGFARLVDESAVREAQAVQAYRIAHSLWNDGDIQSAVLLQNWAASAWSIDIHPAARLGKECSMVARIHRRPTGTVEVVGEAWPTEKTYTHDVLREVFRLNPATAPYMPPNIKPISEVGL